MKRSGHQRLKGIPVLNHKGFTLVELAIALVILGLLTGIGTALLGPLIKQTKYKQTVENVKAAKEAIIGFAISSGRLPTAAEMSSITKDVDAWNTGLFYYPDPALTPGGSSICCTATPGFQIEDTCPPAESCATAHACCKTTNAFVIFSLGENHVDETGAVPTFTILEYGTNYDDIVEYVALPRLREMLSCSALEIRTTSLPQGIEDVSYSAQLQGFGGCTPYAWSPVGALGGGVLLDAAGTISGTVNVSAPPVGTLGTCTGTIGPFNPILTDAQGKTATKNLSILVYPQTLRITNSDLPSTIVAAVTPNFATLNGTGGRNSYTWSLSGNPAWLTVSAATGVVSINNPPAEGDYPFAATLSDTCSSTSKAFSVRVNAAAAGGGAAPTCSLTGPALPISAGQTAALNWAITNGPADGSFAPSSGTCTNFVGSSGGSCTTGPLLINTTFTLTVTNADGSNNCSATVVVNPVIPPTCTLTASPGIVRYNETTDLTWSIINGPADGLFAPITGTCTSFLGSTSGTCTTAPLTTDTPFTLTVSNAFGSSNCSTSAYVGCNNYRVYNDTGARWDFWVDGQCRRINDGGEITGGGRRLDPGETIEQRSSSNNSCSLPVQATIDYDTAMNADVIINGGNGDCRVFFSGADR